METGAAAPVAGQPLKAFAIGRVFDDGLNSRLAAEHFGEALGSVGYDTATFLDGRDAAAAWTDGKSMAVLGVFGHANAGIIQTDEGATDDADQILAAGSLTTLSRRNVWFWGNYLPFLDVDDLRLAIFAGCYTARTDPDLGSWGSVGRRLGVDAVIGFNELVLLPADCTDCDYSGNYFWGRFATYTQTGDTISLALAKARSDLVDKEGDSGGWDSWVIDGAAEQPGDIRIAPAMAGTNLDSHPLGNDLAVPSDIQLSSPHMLRVGEREFWEVRTPRGDVYRHDARTGELVGYFSSSSMESNAESISEDAAQAIATNWAQLHVSWFDLTAGSLRLSRPHHEVGDSLFGYHWRLNRGDKPGPGIVEIEVDRRTGRVVYFSASQKTPVASRVVVSRDQAIRVATAALDGWRTTSVEPSVWNQSIWTVLLEKDGASQFPNRIRATVHAESGKLLSLEIT